MKEKILILVSLLVGFSSLSAMAQKSAVTGVVPSIQHPDSTFGDFTEITPPDSLFITPPDEDFWVIATAPADYDNDGDMDIAVLGFYVSYNAGVEDKLVLMRNEGPAGPEEWDFSYIDVPLGTLTTGSSDMAWGDADADGDLDLAVGTDGITVIYRNDSGSLLATNTVLPGYWEDNSLAYFDLRSITWADFDNDGDLDLLLPSIWDNTTFSYRTALMRNDGTNGTGGWIFTETDSGFPPTMHAQSAWADSEGDGDLDLLLVHVAPYSEEGFIRLYQNDGNGTFTGEDILGSLRIDLGEAQWGDYDYDGDLDILVAGNITELNGSYNPLAIRIYNNDNGTYIPVEVIADPYSEGWFDFTAATWADYDSDGDMDILLAGNYNSGIEIEGRARIYSNNAGVFTDSGNELPAPRAWGDHGGTFSWLDIDDEGDLDYFIAGQYFVTGGNGLVEAQMHLYRNDTPGQNSAPSTPTDLSALQVSDSSALLSWVPGLDDHTPSNALTYDLKLFYDGVSFIVPAHTPEPGNVSAVNEWLLSGLQTGNYTWTLSTIDAAYIASPIATGEFSIGITSADEIVENPPHEYNLGQNYPNPFDHLTTISYSIPLDGIVSLKVYNSQVKEVAILVSEKKQAGNYKVLLDATNLSDGFCYYRLQVGDFSQAKKLVISKR